MPGPLLDTPYTEPIDLSLTLAEVEARYIVAMLVASDWNISEAARRLGIYRSSLQRRMKRALLGELVAMELQTQRRAPGEPACPSVVR